MVKEVERNFQTGQEVYVDGDGGQYKAKVVSVESGYIFGFSEGSKKQLDTTGPVTILPPDARKKRLGKRHLLSLRVATSRGLESWLIASKNGSFESVHDVIEVEKSPDNLLEDGC